MLSAVIADDDPRVCTGISSIIEQNCPHVHVSRTFDDGEQLLNYIENQYVDILITDINMPRRDGLEICQYISDHHRATYMIVITGHHLFEYAKRAIDYRADYFLVKPFSSVELIEHINHIAQKIDEEKREALNSASLYLNNWSLLKQAVLNVYEGRASFQQIQNHLFCNFTLPVNALRCCEVSFIQRVTDSFSSLSEEMLNSDSPVLSSFWTGSSTIVFYRSDEALRQHLRDFERNCLLKYGEAPKHQLDVFLTVREWCDFSNTRVLANQFFGLLLENRVMDAESFIKIHLLAAPDTVVKNFFRMVRSLLEKQGLPLEFSDVEHLSSEELAAFLTEIPKRMIRHASSRALVERTQSFIQESYANSNLSLSDISDKLNVTYSYLGKLFKAKTGKNIIAYLTEVRMENAKRLITETGMSIQKISQAVGYIKPIYFRQKFKEYTGFTPSQFKNLERNGSSYEKDV